MIPSRDYSWFKKPYQKCIRILSGLVFQALEHLSKNQKN